MCKLVSILLLCSLAHAQRPATDTDIKAKDLTILPDGTGLPAGSGNAVRGKDVFKQKCADCHGENAEGKAGQYPALSGGVGSLKTDKPVKTVGSFWPYATT